MNKVEKKRVKEQETIEKMIHIYCKKNHHTKELCSECKELVNYAKTRSQRCLLWQKRHSVRIARCIVISLR